MGGGVFGRAEVESRLVDTVSKGFSPEGPATACTLVVGGSDEGRGARANGGGLGLRSRK